MSIKHCTKELFKKTVPRSGTYFFCFLDKNLESYLYFQKISSFCRVYMILKFFYINLCHYVKNDIFSSFLNFFNGKSFSNTVFCYNYSDFVLINRIQSIYRQIFLKKLKKTYIFEKTQKWTFSPKLL